MKDFGKKSTFASFLPGIAGIKGIPMWCYYVNRGQAVVSFGSENKDNALMEFFPAHVAYQTVKRTGFRTFIRKDGKFFEPFSDERVSSDMIIEKNLLTIKEFNDAEGIETDVTYYIVPEEKIGGLVREVTVKNTSGKETSLEILDGMPALIPYGISIDNMKNMTQTAKAWMQVEKTAGGNAFYRVRASLGDSTSVVEIKAGNYAAVYEKDGSMIYPVTDPDVIFGYDYSLGRAVNFEEQGLDHVLSLRENTSNLLPCAFFPKKCTLAAGESVTLYEIYGTGSCMEVVDGFLKKCHDDKYFVNKKLRARELTEELTDLIGTKTGDKKFDEYVRYTYMDNLLRGGFPIRLGNNKIFYVYSRKHGDIERDYNYFSMLPEYYTQGNGNFRDVNQNRRCDTFFAPFVGKENIHMFYSLIQLDGYNPLQIEKTTYTLSDDKAELILNKLDASVKEEVKTLVTKPFTPGTLYRLLEDSDKVSNIEETFSAIIDFAEPEVNGNFGEGYWCDHWTYNLDLIEDYLSVFPENEKEMLYEEAYSYFVSQANLLPRAKRYVKTEKGIRQYNNIDHASERNTEKLLRKDMNTGVIHYVSLLEKLILLSATKYATLDPYGMGVEMEGGKPGWYDALNGMPALFGSSMGETYELARNLNYTINALKRFPGMVKLTKEVGEFVEALGKVNEKDKDSMALWNDNNDIKEAYRAKVYEGISGETKEYTSEALVKILEGFHSTVMLGIEKAMGYGDGICPMYFTYDCKEYTEDEAGIHPTKLELVKVPDFLEGQVRFLKLPVSKERKAVIYNKVKESDLFDKKLKMYKVNASLNNASYEYGRCRAFTPGWLENESIWLHMEYKYLLELLRSGLYEQYFEDFKNDCIPFLDEEMYGRSVLENSSFLASSINPNPDIHGKGFVARLSGSTIEFISMWKLMMFGSKPFRFENGELSCKFEPAIPAYLVGDDKQVTATLVGHTEVTYHLSEKKDYIPGEYVIEKMEAVYENKAMVSTGNATFSGQIAKDIRDGKVKRIDVYAK